MSKIFITGKAKDNTPEILVYGYIGGEDVCSGDFVKELRNLEKTANKINVRINSGGGSVFEGIAIFNALINSRAEINTYIDGIAASMGSIIALAGKKVYMSKIARFMTHKPSGVSVGSGDDMRNNGKLLDALENTMAGIYAAKTGKSAEECKAAYMGKDDKWFSADEALSEKLVDGIYDAPAINATNDSMDEKTMWAFYNEHRFAAVFTQQNSKENMELKLSAASLAALNITAATTDATVIDNAIAQLKAKADQADADKAAKEKAENDLATFKANAEAAEATALLDAAVKDKKMTVEMKNAFATQFKGNLEGLKAIVATLKPYESKVPAKGEGADNEELVKLNAKTYSQLDKAGELPRLKELDIELFKAKFKEHYKTDYKG